MAASAPPSRWRLGRVLGGLLVLTAIVVAALAAGSQTATFRDWLRRQVIARLNATLVGQVAIGRLDGNLFGGLVATDVRIVLKGQRVLAVRRLAATYDVLTLIGGGPLRIRTLEADGVALQLVADARGWNLERLSRTPTPEDEDRDVIVEHVRLTDAVVRVIRPERVWRFGGLTFAGTTEIGRRRTRVTVDALTGVERGSGVRIEEAVGRIAVDDDAGIVADGIRLRTTGSRLEGSGRMGPRPARVVDAHLVVARLAGDELRALFGTRAPQSDWQGALAASGPESAVVVTGDVRASVVAEGATRDGGRVALEGTFDLRPPTPLGELRATLTRVDLAAVVGPSVPESDLTGTLRLGTVADAPRAVRFGLELREPRLGATTLTRLAVTGTGDAESVRFEADAATPSGSAQATGTIAPATERFDLRLTARRIDAGALTGRVQLAGELNGTATLVGEGFTPARARAELAVMVEPSRIGTLSVSAGTVKARVADERLVIERATLASNAGTVTASGDLALETTHAIRTGGLRAEARLTDLRPLGDLIGRPGSSGAATVTVAALGAPHALDATATMRARGLAGPGWRTGTLDVDLATQRFGDPKGDITLAARGRDVVVVGRTLVALDVSGRWLGDAASARAHVDVRAREASAQHQLTADVQRSPKETRATITKLRLDLRGQSWLATGTPVLAWRDDRLAIDDFAVRSPQGSARLGGVVTRAGTNDIELVVEGLDLAAFEGWIPDEVRGRVAGRAHLGGTLAAPRLDADLGVAAPMLGGVRYDELRARVGVAAGRAAVQARLAQAPAQVLDLDGAVPVLFSLEPWSLAVAGDLVGRVRANAVDLAFVGALWPQLVTKVGGTLTVDLELGGRWNAPEARGTVALAGGRASVVPLGLVYDPVTLALRFEGRTLSIEQLSIQSGQGRLTGGGNAQLIAGDPTMDARFEVKRFPLFANQYGRGAASGWLWISGTLAAPVLEGSLATDGLILQIPEVLPGHVAKTDPTIVVVGPAAPPVAPPIAPGAPVSVPGFYDRAALTVQLAVPRDAWVRRSDANVELQGWMTAWKKPREDFHLAGDIRGVRGWYAFQGKKFTLADGSVRFGGQGLDPVLDITATHQAGDYLVRLKVGGTITKPALTLASEPALDQADVLAVLLFGAPASQLTRSQSTGLREQALGIAGGYVASELRQSVANALGVDDLQFDTGTTGLQDARVSIGKYVADDIFVSLAHKFGAQSVEEIRIEYVIRPGWSLETSTDTLGRSGVDVFWKRRY